MNVQKKCLLVCSSALLFYGVSLASAISGPIKLHCTNGHITAHPALVGVCPAMQTHAINNPRQPLHYPCVTGHIALLNRFLAPQPGSQTTFDKADVAKSMRILGIKVPLAQLIALPTTSQLDQKETKPAGTMAEGSTRQTRTLSQDRAFNHEVQRTAGPDTHS